MWGVDPAGATGRRKTGEIQKMDEAKETEAKICAGGCIRSYANPLEHCDGCEFRRQLNYAS